MQGSYCAPAKFKGKDHLSGPRSCRTGRGRGGPGQAEPHACPALRTAATTLAASWGATREREERGKKKKSPHQTGQNIELSEPSALGPGQGVRGEIFTFLQAKEGRAGGWREGWERVKENKLLLPLNIHDSSFAKANGKHINPFTTLLNAKRKEKKENKMDEGHSLLWANWKEYENLDHRRLEAQGEESGLWVSFRPVPVGVDTSLIHFPSLQ